MERSTFGDRFGYLLWLRHLVTGQAPSFEEVGKAVSRSGVAVSAWRVREEPPPDYRVHDPLSEFFDADRAWVLSGVGHPPEPELWAIWARYRREDIKDVPKEAFKQITKADVAAAKKRKRKGA